MKFTFQPSLKGNKLSLNIFLKISPHLAEGLHILAVILGFVFGFILGIIPLMKNGFSFMKAFKIILIAEGLSIAFMEVAEVLTEIYTPGVMQAGLTDGIFWAGMVFALFMGFIAAFPINILLVKRGIRHQH